MKAVLVMVALSEVCGLRWQCCGAPCARPLNHRGKCLCAVELKYEGAVEE